MNDDSREQRVRKSWEAAWDHGEVDALDVLLGPDYRRYSGSPDKGQTLAEFKASIIATRAAFPDLVTTIDDIVAADDKVAIRWHSVGTHEGSIFGVPPTGRSVEVHGSNFAHFSDDLVVEEFVTWDPRALLTALGIIHVGEDR
jgi:steroid delta-isomerase-like uncharacterized protein